MLLVYCSFAASRSISFCIHSDLQGKQTAYSLMDWNLQAYYCKLTLLCIFEEKSNNLKPMWGWVLSHLFDFWNIFLLLLIFRPFKKFHKLIRLWKCCWLFWLYFNPNLKFKTAFKMQLMLFWGEHWALYFVFMQLCLKDGLKLLILRQLCVGL